MSSLGYVLCTVQEVAPVRGGSTKAAGARGHSFIAKSEGTQGRHGAQAQRRLISLHVASQRLGVWV
jgi:hypothetical protein